MNFNYDELPTRGKITSAGVKLRDCMCGGRRYVSYEERRIYNVSCEKCSIELWMKSWSMDEAILEFNADIEQTHSETEE